MTTVDVWWCGNAGWSFEGVELQSSLRGITNYQQTQGSGFPVSKFVYPSIHLYLYTTIISELTGVHIGVGGEKDTKASLVVDGHAGSVVAAHIDAVSQHEGAGLRVEHVGGRRVHVPRHQLERHLGRRWRRRKS